MRFRRRLETNATINMVPMIDVVFQLIIYFMVATTMIITPGIPITLPESSTTEKVAMSKIVVTVVSQNEIYLNRDRYTLQTLDRALAGSAAQTAISTADMTSGKDQTRVKGAVIEGNADVSYSLMVRVLDILRRNGYGVANLRTRPGTGQEKR
ncbi:MAG: biopolymer transporter ExbD [Spirochaetaceae bacterium]|nr:MAG: biopolymer transporter ExbD [Spirochaetaceae bacterium]